MPDYESWLLMTCALTLPAVTETTSDLTLVYHSSDPSYQHTQQTSSTPYYVTAVATYPPSVASPRRVASFVYTTTYRGGHQRPHQQEEGVLGQLYNVGVIRGGGEAGLVGTTTEVRRQQQWLPQQQQQPLYMSSVPSVQSVQSVQQIRRASPLSESSSIPVNAGRPRLKFLLEPFLVL
jgi:hypothetical protein